MLTLDDIRSAAEKKYIGFDIDLGDGTVITMRNALRLPKKDRERVLATQTLLEEKDADQEAIISQLIELLVGDKTAAKKLLDAFGGDLAMMAELMAQYNKATQVGEA